MDNRQSKGKFQKKNPGVHQVYINDAIKAPNIMIVDADGNNLGVFPRAQAFAMKDQA